MKTYSCYILDDEPLAIKVIEEYLKRLPQFEIAGKQTDSIKAYAEIKELKPTLIFLDIEMPELNGLQLLRSTEHNAQIILTTAYRDYAVEGFELNVLDYLLKPISFERFIKAIDRFLDQFSPTSSTSQNQTEEHILLRIDRKTQKVMLDEILYVKGVKDYVKIVLQDRNLLFKSSIGNFHKMLPQSHFLRIHKSYVVAKNKIRAYSSQDVEIGEKLLPIGRAFKASIGEAMKKSNS
ncbi:MAG: LytTR family DNA-binding domain-containing protein [Bacteroidia bacterium]|nr:LytTR family DNA-binding domain-containing protein [Bacteroidia bacterium]